MAAPPVGAGHREQPLAHSCIFSCSQRSRVCCRWLADQTCCCLKQGKQQMRCNTTSKHASFSTGVLDMSGIFASALHQTIPEDASVPQVYCLDFSGISAGVNHGHACLLQDIVQQVRATLCCQTKPCGSQTCLTLSTSRAIHKRLAGGSRKCACTSHLLACF